MKWVETLGDEKGFTIQETLVVLIVGSLLVSFGLSVFQFTDKLMKKWNKKNEIHAVVNSISQQIALDIQRSGRPGEITDTSLVLAYGLTQEIVFRFTDRSTCRNDVQMCEMPRDELAVYVMSDSGNIIRGDIGTSDFKASMRVSPLWSSRREFEQSRKNWNAAGNRH